MAGRTGIGIGLGSFITILSITWVGLFVTTVAFMAQRSAALKKYKDLQDNNDRYITEAEVASDEVKQMQSAAARDQKSLVRFLLDDQREAMRLATGNEKNNIEGLKKSLEGIPGGRNSNLMQVLRDRELALSTATKNAQDAAKARDQALQDRQSEVERVAQIEKIYNDTMAATRAEVGTYKTEVDTLSTETESYKKDMEVRIEKIRADAQDELAERNARISDLEKEVLLGRSTIQRLQAELKGRTPGIRDEYALRDATIIGIDSAENNVYLDIGSKQKVREGLTFEVFSEVNAIRPDPNTGEYPGAKASLEVIKVDRDSSVARITREKRGNPVVKGDVVANAVFDPNKQYTMLVYGKFDANRDGVATQQEAASIRVLIEEWGGKVVDELQGNVDFLVLGQKPTIPPPPPEGSPGALIQEYIRVKRIADQYDQLLQQAQSTSLPILNENRLYTLIGKRFGL
jgi:hypothetical protein